MHLPCSAYRSALILQPSMPPRSPTVRIRSSQLLCMYRRHRWASPTEPYLPTRVTQGNNETPWF